MIVEFFSRTSFRLKFANHVEILIDPSPESPKFVGHDAFNPKIILCSYFPSHSNAIEDSLALFNKDSGKIKFIYPYQNRTEEDRKRLQVFECFEIQFDSRFVFHGISIFAFTHTSRNRIGFYIYDSVTDTSFLHLAGAPVCRNIFDRRLDPAWLKLRDLPTTFMTMTGGASSSSQFMNNSDFTLRSSLSPEDNPGEWTKIIRENELMSPVECCNLTKLISPKIACLMGMNDRVDREKLSAFSFSSHENEDYFRWCLSEIAPEVETFSLKADQKINLSLLKGEKQNIKIES